MAFSAKTGMDIAFASIFVLAIGLAVADSTVTNLTTAGGNSTPALTGTGATVVGYTTLVIGAGFLYIIARMTGVL